MDEESMKLVWIILDARQRVFPQCPVTESAGGVWPSFGRVLRNKPIWDGRAAGCFVRNKAIVDGPAARTIRCALKAAQHALPATHVLHASYHHLGHLEKQGHGRIKGKPWRTLAAELSLTSSQPGDPLEGTAREAEPVFPHSEPLSTSRCRPVPQQESRRG